MKHTTASQWMPVGGIRIESKWTTGKRTRKALHRTMNCTDFPSVIWSQECLDHIATHDRNYTVNPQVPVYSGIPERCCHFFLDRRRTSGLHADCTGTAVESLVPLKLRVYFLFKDCIYYLDHVIQPGGLGVSTKATNVTWELRHPMNVLELKSFLRCCHIFRQVVPKITRIAALLSCKLENQLFLLCTTE